MPLPGAKVVVSDIGTEAAASDRQYKAHRTLDRSTCPGSAPLCFCSS